MATQFEVSKWEYYPEFVPPGFPDEVEVLVGDKDALIYYMKVDVEGMPGAVNVTLSLEYSEDWVIELDNWEVQGPITRHKVIFDNPMPVTALSKFHLYLSNTSQYTKVTFKVMLKAMDQNV
jgi:hypothetical protein